MFTRQTLKTKVDNTVINNLFVKLHATDYKLIVTVLSNEIKNYQEATVGKFLIILPPQCNLHRSKIKCIYLITDRL